MKKLKNFCQVIAVLTNVYSPFSLAYAMEKEINNTHPIAIVVTEEKTTTNRQSSSKKIDIEIF